MADARYDGLADWYDKVMRDPQRHEPLAVSACRLLTQLAGPGNGLAIDIGCGTGIFAAPVTSLGYKPVGGSYSPSVSGRDVTGLDAGVLRRGAQFDDHGRG